MKSVWGLGLVAIFGISTLSCMEEPQYSNVPSIEFDKILFKDIKDGTAADSLIISLKFKDGNGDLGIDPSEIQEPFNDKYYFQFPDKSYITYKTKRTNPNYDTLPAFVTPYNCTNWEVITKDQKVLDTLYFQLNPNYNNIFITFQVKDAKGEFADYDWSKIYVYPLCAVNGFNGRFPILSKDLRQPGTLEGTIRYAMVSTGFNAIFSIKTLRLKVKIQDRSLNRSNEIITPEFTLKTIPG